MVDEELLHPVCPVESLVADLVTLPSDSLQWMAIAGAEILECWRVLNKAGLNVVGEVLRGQGPFVELEHYPADDVFDQDSHAQYYYHAHRGAEREHGHFHLFLRQEGMPDNIRPAAVSGSDSGEPLTHLFAIAMDAYGFPIGLFAVNRWVSAETWYRAEDVIRLLDRFVVDHAFPSWPVNRWISAMPKLFRPEVEALLRHRDRVIAHWAARHPHMDPFEDRALEVTGYIPIRVHDTIARVRALLSCRFGTPGAWVLSGRSSSGRSRYS